MNVETEPIDEPLTDTGRKIVGEAVRRIREELEMHRALLRDDIRQVVREERRSWIKIIAYALGVLKDP